LEGKVKQIAGNAVLLALVRLWAQRHMLEDCNPALSVTAARLDGSQITEVDIDRGGKLVIVLASREFASKFRLHWNAGEPNLGWPDKQP
jgi:hypothetical protein